MGCNYFYGENFCRALDCAKNILSAYVDMIIVEQADGKIFSVPSLKDRQYFFINKLTLLV